MDTYVCASCHKGLSLDDIGRGNFKRLAGRLYCAECVAKMRRVGPTLCPQCGTTDTPLYTGMGYTCRKCGAELTPASDAGQAQQAPQTRARKPTKRCPYCGATLAAEALKCRYCSSSLTRDAHDLEAFARRDSQLRFWLGCLVSASAFLLIALLYVLLRRPTLPAPQGAARPTPAAAAAAAAATKQLEASLEVVEELRNELHSVRDELALIKARQQRLAEGPPPATPPRTTPVAAKGGVTPESAKPAPPPEVALAPKAKGTEPEAKAPTPPKADVAPLVAPAKAERTEVPVAVAKKPEERTAAEAAAAAYPMLATNLDKLKAARRYGDALAACRQFLAAHLGTPEAEKAQAAQKALRDELERIREDHAGRFRQAVEKRDADGARRVLAEIIRYDAPEIREDRERMLTDIKAIEQKPALDEAKYLSQWEIPPNVARLLKELKTEKDWTARSGAARRLAQLGHRSALAGLIEALSDPEWYVTFSVINALSEIGDPIALPHVIPLTKASFPGIYDHAARACRTLAAAPRDKFAEAWQLIDSKQAAQQIVEALKLQGKEESAVTSRYQVALIETLALLGAKETEPAIRPLANSKDPAVAKAAADAIKKLTGQEAPPEAPKAPEAPKPGTEPKAAPTPAPATPPAAPKAAAPPPGTPPR